MDRFLQSLPNGLVATGAVVIFILLLLQMNPFHTACDSQINLLKEKLNPAFFTKADPKRPDIIPASLYSKYKERCMKGASQGSCLQWFESLKRLDSELLSSPSTCTADILAISEISKILTESLQIMVRLAWGPKAPESAYDKNSWFQSFHLRSFCNLRDWYSSAKGKEAWIDLRESLMDELPGASELSRKEVWSRSILSTSCSSL